MHGLYLRDLILYKEHDMIPQPFKTCYLMLSKFESIEGIGIVYKPDGLRVQVNAFNKKGLMYWNVFINGLSFIDKQSFADLNGFEEFFKLATPTSSFVNLKNGELFYITLNLK